MALSKYFQEHKFFQVTLVFLVLILITGNIIALPLAYYVFDWKIISGFNLGWLGSIGGCCLIYFSTQKIFSSNLFLQLLAFVSFIARILFYSIIILLVIFFQIGDLISTVLGLSMTIIALFCAGFFFSKKQNKTQKET